MKERIEKLVKMIESNDIEGFLDDIDNMAASKAYLVIRDNINATHVKKIKESGKYNYQKFQDIKLRAKQSWEYDHKVSTMEDVNRACMNLYTIVLRLMNAQNTDNNDIFSNIMKAINRIEEKVGLTPTIWEDAEKSNKETKIDGGTNNDTNNVQGVKEDI